MRKSHKRKVQDRKGTCPYRWDSNEAWHWRFNREYSYNNTWLKLMLTKKREILNEPCIY